MKNFPIILILDEDDVIQSLLQNSYGDVNLQILVAQTPVEALEMFISNDIGLLILRDVFPPPAVLEFRDQVYRMQDNVPCIVFLGSHSDPISWMNQAQTTLLRDTAEVKSFHDVLDRVFNDLQRKEQIENFESEKEIEFEFYKQILQEQQNFFLITDRSGNVEFTNKAVEAFLNVPHYSLQNEHFLDYMEDGLKVWNYSLVRLGKRADRFTKEFVLKNSLGELKPIELMVYEIFDPKNRELIVFEGLIPGEKNIDKKLDANALKLVTRFSSGIADEIINPVNVILGRLQLIAQSNSIPDEMKRSLEVLENQAISIQQSTQRLVAFARLREDSVPQHVNLNLLIKEACASDEIKIYDQLQIKLNLKSKLPVLNGLQEHLNILIQTLISETIAALKFPAVLQIITSSHHDADGNEYIKLSFEDDQRADTDNLKQQMLLPYYARKSQTDSVGIANTLISTIIDRYDGSLSVRSSRMGGAELSITFPTK